MTVGYTSDTTAQVHAQVEDMISPDIQSAIADWYGRSNASIEAATTLLKNKAEAHSGKLEFAIMEEGLHCRLRPTALVASANPGTPVSAIRALIDGQQAYEAHGDTQNTALKVVTGSHQISIQSLDASGNPTATRNFKCSCGAG